VIADYGRRLDLAGIIDRACPMRDLALLTHGQVIEALIANRLTSPVPLVKVTDWARDHAVTEVFGIDPAQLNDDRIGRALDAVAPELAHIIGSVGAQAISAFGLDTSRLHWDMTSISLYGAYDQTDTDHPTPKFGHPKDRRPDLKQIQARLAVTGDGGIPIFHHAYDGGGERPYRRDRGRPAGQRLPAHPDRHRSRHRQAHPALVVRPSDAGGRGGHRRLVRVADQPVRRHRPRS